MLSAVIITKNEERMIGDCLKSMAWANEIIVVDSGSTDRTVEIAKAHGARVVQPPDWPGFGVQKNRAVDAASGDWVLSLDADERVPPELHAEIAAAVSTGDFDAYAIPRLSRYCGRFMRHSGWWPDYVTRLFRHGCARFSEDPLHERLIVDGSTGRLRNHLVHLSFEHLEEVLKKVSLYSTIGAPVAHKKGKAGSLQGAVPRGCWTFFRTYVIKRVFSTGRKASCLRCRMRKARTTVTSS